MGIAEEKYVSVTTYRRNGEAVATAVWIVPLADGRAGFTTASDSGKVKRLGHTPGVMLRPCDRRGKVDVGTSAVSANATFSVEDADVDEVKSALGRKYGVQAALVDFGGTLRRAFKRNGVATGAVIISFD